MRRARKRDAHSKCEPSKLRLTGSSTKDTHLKRDITSKVKHRVKRQSLRTSALSPRTTKRFPSRDISAAATEVLCKRFGTANEERRDILGTSNTKEFSEDRVVQRGKEGVGVGPCTPHLGKLFATMRRTWSNSLKYWKLSELIIEPCTCLTLYNTFRSICNSLS